MFTRTKGLFIWSGGGGDLRRVGDVTRVGGVTRLAIY